MNVLEKVRSLFRAFGDLQTEVRDLRARLDAAEGRIAVLEARPLGPLIPAPQMPLALSGVSPRQPWIEITKDGYRGRVGENTYVGPLRANQQGAEGDISSWVEFGTLDNIDYWRLGFEAWEDDEHDVSAPPGITREQFEAWYEGWSEAWGLARAEASSRGDERP